LWESAWANTAASAAGIAAVVVIDEVAVSDGDYIDIGEPIADDDTVVVAVKTLIFGE